MKTIFIGLIGDRNEAVTAHRAIPIALKLAADALQVSLEHSWLGTTTIAQRGVSLLQPFQGLWCVPASPYESMDGALLAIRHAREQGIPFLGTCGGFQHALIEYARNVLGKIDADHEETAPDAPLRLVSRLSCSLVEKKGRVKLAADSKAAVFAKTLELEEEYHCNFGLNPQQRTLFDRGVLRVVGEDESGEARVVEMATHPFFICTLFQPERQALKGVLHPFIRAFAEASTHPNFKPR